MAVTLSSSYRITIPKEVRKTLQLKPGMKFEMSSSNGLIHCIPVNFISLEDLKINKKAAGRHKDLNDLENLP